MTSRHLLGCAAVVLAAGALIAVLAPSASTLALVAAFLVCPLVMVIAMKLLMGGGHDGHGGHAAHDHITQPERPQEVGR